VYSKRCDHWAVYSGVWPLSYLSIYVVFVFTGLIDKALCLGLVQFYGKLCPFVSKNFNSDGPDRMRVGGVTESVFVITICGFPTLCCTSLYPWNPHGLIWSTSISGTSLWVGHLTVVVLLVGFWAFWQSIAYSLILRFLSDSSIIASLELGFVLF